MEFFGITVLVVCFLILLILGVPIAISIGVSGILTMLVSIDSLPAFTTFAQRMATGLDNFALLAIPFFILAGNIMNRGGMAIRLINLARVIVGKLPAGLAVVNVFANMLFGAISGSAAASASAIGSIMKDEMKNDGYDSGFSAAVNISSATTGLSIPPSNSLIVYSLASGGASVTALFLAGYLPGILTGVAIMLIAMSMMIYKKKGIKGVASALLVVTLISFILLGAVLGLMYAAEYSANLYHIFITIAILAFVGFYGYKFKRNPISAKRKFKILFDAIPSIFLLIIVVGGIVAGFFTATEASAVAVLYSLVLSLLYRDMTMKDMPKVLLQSVKTTSIVLFLVATCIGLSWIMAYENIPQDVSAALMGISDNKIVILLLINMILLFVGIFMDMTPAILIFTPIFLPIVTQLGVNPVHFGIILVLNLSVGLCTPPVGSVLFIGCSVANVKIEKVIIPLLPMFMVMILTLLLVTFIPQISMWLPTLFGV